MHGDNQVRRLGFLVALKSKYNKFQYWRIRK